MSSELEKEYQFFSSCDPWEKVVVGVSDFEVVMMGGGNKKLQNYKKKIRFLKRNCKSLVE